MANLDFSFAATDASTKNFDTYKIINPPLAEQQETKIDIPKMPGLTQLLKKFTKREIRVQGKLYGSSHSDLITKIQSFSAFLFSEDDEQLIFSNQSDRYFSAQHLRNIELIREPAHTLIELLFTCNDPFGYAVTADYDTESNITIKGYQWTIVNNGQYWVYPVCTITFNQNQTHIYLRNTSVDGCRFDISKSFVNTDVLVINSKDMSIRLNDVNSPAGFGDGGDGKGEFILLKTGNNIMEVGTDDASLDVDININFRKVYL